MRKSYLRDGLKCASTVNLRIGDWLIRTSSAPNVRRDSVTGSIIVAPDEDRRTGIVQELVDLGVPATTGTIDTDYLWAVGAEIYVGERKTPTDLIASVNDGRLREQAEVMAGHYGFILLDGVPLGSVGFQDHAWTWDAFDNLCASLQEQGIVIYRTVGHLAERLASIWHRSARLDKNSWRRVALPQTAAEYADKDYYNLVRAYMALLHGYGCGEQRANDLAKAFGLGGLGVTEVGLQEARQKWTQIKGIGQKLANEWIRVADRMLC